MSAAEEIFGEPDFLRKLGQLDLVVKQLVAGSRYGGRRSVRRGAGTIFSDYRSYSRGDDPRYVDWNIYGRLGTLFVKEFEVEESARIRLFLDRSLSMDFGSPRKFEFARRIAAALAYIGLAHFDQVEIVALPGGDSRAASGRDQAPALFDFLLELETNGETDLLATVRRALAGATGRGVSIVLSDLLDPGGFRSAVEHLLRKRHQVFLVQVVAPDELDLPGAGALRLVDAETGRTLDVNLDKRLVNGYRDAFQSFCDGVERFAFRHEIGYARMRSDMAFGEAVLSLLKRGRVVR